MSGLLGGRKSQSTSEPRLNALEVNQSSYGNVVPLVYGTDRVPITLLWYGAFTATAHTERQPGGKGGGRGGSNTTYTYSAALVAGLAEGPVASTGFVWSDKEITSLSALNMTFFSGAGPQTTWSYLSTNFPTQAIPYDHTAYLASGSFDLGSSAALPNLTIELYGLQVYNIGTINDAEPSDIVIDYCTDANHGCNFNFLGSLQGAGATTWETWCIANGFFISPAELTQRQARDFLGEILRITNSDAVGSADVLRIVPYGDESVTGNSRTYTPNLAPLYSFTDDDFVVSGSEDPVRPKRKPEAEVFNVVRVEYRDRANQYNTGIAEAKDDAHIALYGERVMPTVRLHAIKSASLARKVAQHILLRQLYIRNSYEFTVRADYCLLEPMDLVAITDTKLGLNAQLVRVTDVAEDDEHQPTITAEEVPVGVSVAPVYAWGAAQGYAQNEGADPGSVAAPLIFAAPPMLVSGNGGYELWIAVAGTNAVWGGCEVHLSFDGTSYGYMGTIAGSARYGTLLSAFGTGADPDTGTVNFQLADTGRTLVAGTTTDADELRTLLYVDGEVMSYRDATLIGTGQYTLGYFRRGKYGTTRAAHSIGASWARLDAGIFRLPIDPGFVGKTMRFKFPSFNHFGRMLQTLAACTEYTFTLKPIAQPGAVTFTLDGITQVGNTLTKVGNTDSTWDAQAYSNEGYATGCYASARPAQADKECGFGLNSDPTTNASYTSIDYWWNLASDSIPRIYEGGALVGTFGTYTNSDTFAISCDGFFVRYFKNGVEVRRVVAPPAKLHFDSSFYRIGATLLDVTFAPITVDANTSTKFQLAGVSQVGTTLRKLASGSGAWDSQAYSSEGYGGGCYASARAAQTNGTIMFGLNSDPTTDADYTSLDFAWYVEGDGTLYIYESGNGVQDGGTHTTATLLAISWDGGRIRYWKDGVIVRETPYAGGKLHFDSSFYSPNAALADVQFSPLGIVAGGTIQGAALNRDPNFTDAGAWVDTSGNPLPAARFVTITDGVAGNTALRTASGVTLNFESADRIVVDPAKTYRLRARVRASTNNTLRFYFGIDLRDSAGAIIAGVGTYWSYGAASYQLIPSAWTEYSFVFGAGTSSTFPSNARTMQTIALLNYDAGAGYVEMQDVRIEECAPTALLAPGAATTTQVASLATQTQNYTTFAPPTFTFCALSYTNTTQDTVVVEISYTFGATVSSNNATTTINSGSGAADGGWTGTKFLAGGGSITVGEVFQGVQMFSTALTNASATRTKTFVDTITLAPGDRIDLSLYLITYVQVGGGGPYSATAKVDGALLRLAVIKR